ncbi:hypothetical protein RCIP0104_00053 [Klebsiella phage RCIP0104]
MAFSWQEQIKPAGTQDIQCDIEYLDKSYIHVYLDGEETTGYTWTSSTNIRLNTALTADTTVLLIRKTEREYLYIEFASGSPFIEVNVDSQNTQFLHLAQELVEGRAIPGFYGTISMNGYRITDLANPINAQDAATKAYVDAADTLLGQRIDAEHAGWVDAVAAEAVTRKAADDALGVRTTNLEQTFISGEPTVSYPWYTVLAEATDEVTPGLSFTKAIVYVQGVNQIPGYSFEVVDNTLLFAEVLPAGTLVSARLGYDAELSETYATVTALGEEASARANADAQIILDYQAAVATKAAKGANSDITSLSGLTTPLSKAQGGTGNTSGAADSAAKLSTARALVVDLTSITPASFDGTVDATMGATGILPITKGGTGAGDAATARANLGAAASGSNGDITALTGLSGGISGRVDGAAAAAGVVGEVLSAATAAAVSVTSGTPLDVLSLSLPAGEYELESALLVTNSGNVTALSFGVSSTSAVLPSNWYDLYSITTTLAAGNSSRQGMSRRLRLSATTTVYLVAQATFTGTCTAQGYIRAMRVR